MDECKALCSAEPTCKSFEYGVDHGGTGTAYQPGDCQLQSAATPISSPSTCIYHNLDLYTRTCAGGSSQGSATDPNGGGTATPSPTMLPTASGVRRLGDKDVRRGLGDDTDTDVGSGLGAGDGLEQLERRLLDHPRRIAKSRRTLLGTGPDSPSSPKSQPKYKYKFNATMSTKGLNPNPVTSYECGDGYGYESKHAAMFCTGSSCDVDQVGIELVSVLIRIVTTRMNVPGRSGPVNRDKS